MIFLSLEGITSLRFLYLPIISLACGSFNTGCFGVALKIQALMFKLKTEMRRWEYFQVVLR